MPPSVCRSVRSRGDSVRVKTAGFPVSTSASELYRNVPHWLVVRFCEYTSFRTSVSSFTRCLLFSLNQESVFMPLAVFVDVLVFRLGLPPKPRLVTPVV